MIESEEEIPELYELKNWYATKLVTIEEFKKNKEEYTKPVFGYDFFQFATDVRFSPLHQFYRNDELPKIPEWATHILCNKYIIGGDRIDG